ncbi:MAG: plasmid pRiA4b ORF-3 family protein [Dethiosulfatibacter sp.]|nr:plasmid pRiA4b ORF-3 family protein [Dethiosulfatibacter sp.]
MLIKCTKKLLDTLDAKVTEDHQESLMFSWHANVVTVNRRKTVILLNDLNRYVIVLYGLKKKDFSNMDKLILRAINDVFEDECLNEDIINAYFQEAGGITYTTTKDRSSTSRLNRVADWVNQFYDLLIEDSVIQSSLSMRISRILVSESKGSKDYIVPVDLLHKNLEESYSQPVIKCKAVVMKVTLDLDNFDVWRRFIVPVNTTYTVLHKVLQKAFVWRDYHLHHYYIYGDQGIVDTSMINHPNFHKEGYLPILNIVSDEYAFNDPDDLEMIWENGVRLSEIPFEHAKYTYDFGDNWQHYIEVEGTIEDFDCNHPVFVDGSGDTPPEDVGGESGYENFLAIISDPDEEEHEDFKLWAEEQRFRKYDPVFVKKEVEDLFRRYKPPINE